MAFSHRRSILSGYLYSGHEDPVKPKNHCNVTATERQGDGPMGFSGRISELRFEVQVGPWLATEARRKSFLGAGNSYRAGNRVPFILKRLRDGTPFALGKGRRSGAQRGASENNFGQRFSVSTPCFCLLDAVEPSPQKLTHGLKSVG
jgi:hypothetical protein